MTDKENKPLNDLPIFWGIPTGKMFLFNSEEEVRKFFSKTGMDEESMYTCGVGVKEDTSFNDEEENIYGHHAVTLPTFHNNPYLAFVDQKAYISTTWNLYSQDSLELDTGVWSEYPCIMYLNVEEGFSKHTDTSVFICHIVPLSEMLTVSTLEKEEEEYKQVWLDNLQEKLDHEAARDEWLRQKEKHK